MKLPKVILSGQKSVLIVDTPNGKENYFRLKVGYNAPTHFSTKYIFKVYPKPLKILIEDQLSGLELSVADWQNLVTYNCEDLGGDMENGFKTQCVYESNSFERVYNQYFFIDNSNEDGIDKIQRNLPVKNKEETFADESLSIEYNWINENKFEVVLNFAGGVTSFEFEQMKNKIEVVKTASPD